jgi:hypothetical protein
MITDKLLMLEMECEEKTQFLNFFLKNLMIVSTFAVKASNGSRGSK